MSKTNDRHVDDHLIDGGEGSGDQELLADFRILINEVARRVIVEAVKPELSGAVRDLRGSADSARDSLKRSAGQLEQLARSTRDERNAFKDGLLNALSAAFQGQRTALAELAMRTEAAIESAAAVTSAQSFEVAVDEARRMAAALRMMQAEQKASSEALATDLAALARGVQKERNVFKAGFADLLTSAFDTQATTLMDLALRTEAAIQSAAAVTSAEALEIAVSSVGTMTDSLREAQEEHLESSAGVAAQALRLSNLSGQIAGQLAAMEGVLVDQGSRLDRLAADRVTLEQGLRSLTASIDSLSEGSGGLLRRHEALSTSLAQQTHAMISDQHAWKQENRRYMWAFSACMLVILWTVLTGP